MHCCCSPPLIRQREPPDRYVIKSRSSMTGAARHGVGGLAIINLSGLALSGSINKDKITLTPGLNPTVTIARSATITLSTPFKNRSYQSYASTVSLGRNERALLILFPPFHKGGLEVQSRLLLDQPPAATGSSAPSR
jgi:hypothetical protein